MLALPLMAAAAPPRTWTATVVHVTDGDTLWVRPSTGGASVQLRVKGIDAPEICQPHGLQARQALEHHLLHRPVTVVDHGRDDYDRTLARVQWSGTDVGGWLVFNGLAWSHRYQRRPGPYDSLEQQARQARRGLWAAGRPMEPRAFRKAHGSCEGAGGAR
ncbi:MAG TPA: thermonuclease family protein [Ramlibacter sp.]|nr:thermonuclease family protein [Ramlibacter sp.]